MDMSYMFQGAILFDQSLGTWLVRLKTVTVGMLDRTAGMRRAFSVKR